MKKGPTLKHRKIRGDMIELYKIFAGKYDSEITEWITGKCIERQYDTRNHRFALQQQSHIHYDIRKFSFSNRIIPLWNSLPDNIVSSPTLETHLKHGLTNFGRTKMFDITGKLTYCSPEVEVKLNLQLINLLI